MRFFCLDDFLTAFAGYGGTLAPVCFGSKHAEFGSLSLGAFVDNDQIA
jgi:hypothetical protein